MTKSAPLPSFLLLSRSPRRRELLQKAGFHFELVDNAWPEEGLLGESALKRVKRLSAGKLLNYLTQVPQPQLPVLSADTLLEFRGKPLEKPDNEAEAWHWYQLLAGRSHRVLTALTLWNPHRRQWFQEVEATKVEFVPWDEELYANYLAQGEWHDAAGGYKIQESGERLVKRISGSWSNVVGLPIARFYGMLRQCLGSGLSSTR